MTEVPGNAVLNRWITDACRVNGDLIPFETVVNEMRESYNEIVKNFEGHPGVKIHMVMTLERPPALDKPPGPPDSPEPPNPPDVG
jgi:hypothetical protein